MNLLLFFETNFLASAVIVLVFTREQKGGDLHKLVLIYGRKNENEIIKKEKEKDES